MVVLERDCVDFDIGVVNNNTATAIRKVQISVAMIRSSFFICRTKGDYGVILL